MIKGKKPGGSVRGERTNLKGLVLGCIEAKFASKYAFESSRRDLHNALLCTAPKSHFFKEFLEFAKIMRQNLLDFKIEFFAKIEFCKI